MLYNKEYNKYPRVPLCNSRIFTTCVGQPRTEKAITHTLTIQPVRNHSGSTARSFGRVGASPVPAERREHMSYNYGSELPNMLQQENAILRIARKAQVL
jgi:hypothetical protein